MGTDDAVMMKGVDLGSGRPRRAPGAAARAPARGERAPATCVLQELEGGLEIAERVRILVGGGGDAANEARPFRPYPGACRVEQHREAFAVERRLDGEHGALARATSSRYRDRARSRRRPHRRHSRTNPAGSSPRRRYGHRRRGHCGPRSLPHCPPHRCAALPCGAPHDAQQRPGVEPALIARPVVATPTSMFSQGKRPCASAGVRAAISAPSARCMSTPARRDGAPGRRE